MTHEWWRMNDNANGWFDFCDESMSYQVSISPPRRSTPPPITLARMIMKIWHQLSIQKNQFSLKFDGRFSRGIQYPTSHQGVMPEKEALPKKHCLEEERVLFKRGSFFNSMTFIFTIIYSYTYSHIYYHHSSLSRRECEVTEFQLLHFGWTIHLPEGGWVQKAVLEHVVWTRHHPGPFWERPWLLCGGGANPTGGSQNFVEFQCFSLGEKSRSKVCLKVHVVTTMLRFFIFEQQCLNLVSTSTPINRFIYVYITDLCTLLHWPKAGWQKLRVGKFLPCVALTPNRSH